VGDDDKDSGDRVGAELRRSEQVVAEELEFAKAGHRWRSGDSVPERTNAEFGGRAGWFLLPMKSTPVPLMRADRQNLTVIINKDGTDGWDFKVEFLVEFADGSAEEWLDSRYEHLEDNVHSHAFSLTQNVPGGIIHTQADVLGHTSPSHRRLIKE
jgi:hypothetical protein